LIIETQKLNLDKALSAKTPHLLRNIAESHHQSMQILNENHMYIDTS